MQVILAYNAIAKIWGWVWDGKCLLWGREGSFFLKYFKTDLQSFGVNIWAQIPTPVYISAHLNMLRGWGGSFWSGWGCGGFFSCCFDFFVLFYGRLLLVEVFKSLFFCVPVRRVFSSPCISPFTSQPQLCLSEDLDRTPFWFCLFCFLALFV